MAKHTIRKSLTLAATSYGAVYFPIPEGAILKNITVETDLGLAANGEYAVWALRNKAKGAFGTPNTAGTLYFQRLVYRISTNGSWLFSGRYEDSLRNKKLGQVGLYFEMYSGAGGASDTAIEIEFETNK